MSKETFYRDPDDYELRIDRIVGSVRLTIKQHADGEAYAFDLDPDDVEDFITDVRKAAESG